MFYILSRLHIYVRGDKVKGLHRAVKSFAFWRWLLNITSFKRMKIFKSEDNRLLMVFELLLPKITDEESRAAKLFNSFYSDLADSYTHAATELSKKLTYKFVKVSVDYLLEKKTDEDGELRLLSVRRRLRAADSYEVKDDDFFSISDARIISRKKYNKTAAKM